MKSLLIFLVILSAHASACEFLKTGKNICLMKFDGKIRRYVVYLPQGLDSAKKNAIVVDLHGFSSSAFQQEQISGMKQVADKEKFIVVWPNGAIGPTGQRYHDAGVCCNIPGKDQDDVGFMRAIIKRTSAQVLIDRKRIFATGLSNGGALVYKLFCEASDLFTAFAPLVFNFDEGLNCRPEITRPIFSFNSIQDAVVPFEGGQLGILGKVLSVKETLKEIKTINKCSDSFSLQRLKGASRCFEFHGCQESVNHCFLDNPKQPAGGHILYFNDDKLSLAPLIWKFFQESASDTL